MFRWKKKETDSTPALGVSSQDHPYAEKFLLEVQSWCYGLSRIEDRLLPGVVHRVIKELAPAFVTALQEKYAFDLVDVAENIHAASGGIVEKKEIVFSLLANLPDPLTLSHDERCAFTMLVAQVEKVYGGAVSRMKQKWQLDGPIAPLRVAVSTSR